MKIMADNRLVRTPGTMGIFEQDIYTPAPNSRSVLPFEGTKR